MKHETLTFRFLDMSRGGVARLFLLLLLPCLSVIGVKAADNDGGVKVTFNPAVRYSQWAINSRLYDFRGNQKAYGFAKWNSNTESLGEYANKANMKLDYVAGLVGKATLEASDYYVDFEWAKPWFKSAQAYATNYNYSAQEKAKMTLDNMNAAKMAFHIINNSKWGEDAAKTKAKNAIEAIITDLRYYNEYNVIGGTNSEVKKATANDVQKKMLGGWFHKYNYVDQVWCDGMYMGPALLAQLIDYKKAINNVSNDDWSLLTKQFSITWEQLRDSKTGLLYHGMTATPTITDWSKDATPTSYHSGAFWGRANAWYMLALVDVLELMPTSNTNYSTLKGYLENLAASIASYQNEDGTWYQVLDQKDNALEGNYEESSCSALFTAAYLKALRLNLLESSKYETMAKKAYVALVNKFMAYDKDDNNKIQILGSCCSAGLGTNNNKLRDGSRSYYINGNDSKVVTGENTGYYYTEGKVLGGFIMAATEYERAYQNQDSKQILFARDLAPSYDFTTTDGKLDATAYGSVDGNITYQWYKDGSAIADATDATSATYTPTERGSYYCEATANGKTIKTSTTTVKAKNNSNTDNGSTDNNGGSDNGSASDGTVTFSADQLKNYSSPMTDASKIVTIATSAGSVKKESDGDIKVAKSAAFTISVPEGKYIKSITYKIKDSSNGELTFNPTDAKKVTSSDNLTYTYNYSDNKLSSVTATNSANKGGIQVTSIKVVYGTISSVKKYTVSATEGAGGSVSIANASGTTVTSGTEVEANTSLTFTATPNEGYEFVNWTDASNTEVSTNATYTTTVSAAISLTANFKAETPVDPTESGVKPVFLESFKGITINLHQDSKNRTITVPLIHDGEDVSSYFKYTYTITPTGNTSNVTGSTLNFTPETAGTYSVAVSATPDSDGTNDYSDVYDNPEPITFTLKVDSKYQTISVDSDPKNLKMFAGTTRVAPDLTVKVGTTTLDDTKYTVSWFSTSPGVVKVDATTGKIEAVSEGTAKIRVVVTGENLESTTALITVEVDDPAMYRVHANEEYKSQKTMWNQDENLSVTLGGWLFPNDVTNLWTTKESLSSTVEWNYDNTQKNYNSRKASWKITGFDYMVEAGDRQKNARQEKGSNCMPETTLISNADYTKKEYIVDPMFNVPCSGSFLVFQPKTNGTVVAHIYQNGVFDSKKNNNSTDYQYRPQRRVFIMDEAGNFVSSDAHIESTTGKPNGKNYNLSDYKWDMGDKQSPTVDLVKKHFGLESFEMSETGFKNNVYENQLDQETAPNEAATKYPNLKGSRGWSVLADAPVTYKFKVKAGKSYYLYNFGSKIGFYGFSFDEDETKPVEDVVSYDDNTTNTIEATAAGHVAKVTVNRKMTKGIWTTCVLPFSLNRQQVDAIFGNTYSIGNENGTQILYFDRVEGNKVYFVRHAYNTIVAGKPFLIKPTKDVTSINTAEIPDYPYVTIENTKPEDWCTGNSYTWASSYSNDMIVKEGDGFISKDGLFKNFVGESGTLKGFRGYLKRTETQPGAKPTMLQVVNSSNVDGDNGETTGIEDLIIDADGQLMPANGKVYNINGQLVSEDANSFQSLPSGIYIINGKKYIK